MEITFRIHYNTQWGENIRIHHTTSEHRPCQVATLTPTGGGFWEYHLNTDSKGIFYRYEFEGLNGIHILEKEFRHFMPYDTAQITDTWRSPNAPSNALYSAAFTHAVFQHQHPIKPAQYNAGQLVIRLREIRLEENEAFCLISQQHGNWDTQSPCLMERCETTTWVCHLEKPQQEETFTFKFGIWDLKHNQFKGFEDGPNRHIQITPNEGAIIINIDGFNHSSFWRGAGVAVPVFSLRTSQSVGCGEFSDLIPLADWCHSAGLKMIQLLPINDTMATNSWVDTYPYNAISVMAFHPMYINVQKVLDYYTATLTMELAAEAQSLNQEPLVDYEKTLNWKLKALKTLFQSHQSKITSDPEIKHYFEVNQWWIADYAVFSVLRDRYHTPDFRQWQELGTYNKRQVEAILRSGSEEAHKAWFYIFIQFHLQRQLEEAIEHAHSKRIALKGDLPIGINPNSVEAWVDPMQFNFGLQAGAPPDFFSANGQNWGFPTYNWETMQKDGYAWWQQRLGRMQQFFDAFRIDHILGFFRIWSIPKPFTDGIMGHFDPSLPLDRGELQRFNFHGDPEYFALPVVDRPYIEMAVGMHAETIDEQLFTPTALGHRRMKQAYFNPEAAKNWVEQNIPPQDQEMVFKGLLQLMREILFIPATDSHWHPRIMLTDSRLFGQLSNQEQVALKQIHTHYFYERHNEFWKQSATVRLEGTLKACQMLVCGEDLGMIPASVPEVMQKLQILSLEIQRMPKDINQKYGNTWQYPYLSVCTTSTHDISSLRGWWEENRDESAFYFHHVLHRQGEIPQHLTDDLAKGIIEMHLQSPSMWCIVPLQDITAMDPAIPKLLSAQERINEPAIPRHYWRYRVPFNIDWLLVEHTVHKQMKKIVENSGR